MATADQEALWNDLHRRTCMLFAVWRLHKSLYGEKTTVDRMNKVSGSGFRILQDCLVHEQIRLAMALTDPAGPVTRANLSIERLVQTLPEEGAKRICNALDRVKGSMAIVRAHRNRRLMHFDLNTAVGVKTLTPLLGKNLDDVVRGIGAVMSDISVALTCAHQAYEHIGIANAEGAMTWMISDSVRYKHLRELAGDPAVSDTDLRRMVRDRGGRQDRRRGGSDG